MVGAIVVVVVVVIVDVVVDGVVDGAVAWPGTAAAGDSPVSPEQALARMAITVLAITNRRPSMQLTIDLWGGSSTIRQLPLRWLCVANTSSSRRPRGRGAVVLLLALAFPVLPAQAEEQPPGRYVALGDSYSSGQGVEPFQEVGGDLHPCRRSERAYPELVAKRSAAVDSFEFWACAGAHVNHLRTDSSRRGGPPHNDPDAVPPGEAPRSALDRLGPDVTLVTVTIGGNDAGFGSVMFSCVLPFFFGSCTDLEDKTRAALAELDGKLEALYRDIRAAVAPAGRVLVLGYPSLFPEGGGGPVCLDGGFISRSERRWLNEKAAQLNDVIRGNVARVAGVEFVDVTAAFESSQICGEGDALLFGASVRNPGHSFHPNYKGHRVMAAAVLDHLREVDSPVAAPPAPAPSPPPAVLPPPTTVPPPAAAPAPASVSVGVFDPATGRWHLRHPDGYSMLFYYGNPGDVPLLGDWDCDGVATVGMFRPRNGFAYLRNSNDLGVADQSFYYGRGGDVPLAGDWDGDGCDTLAIYRPSENRVFVSNSLGTRPADFSFALGRDGDVLFAGDFDGDGDDAVGIHRPGWNAIMLHNDLDSSVDRTIIYRQSADVVVAGDWDGDGADTLGVYRPAEGRFLLWESMTLEGPDWEVVVGKPAHQPVAGKLA